jgi:hypothetical protein
MRALEGGVPAAEVRVYGLQHVWFCSFREAGSPVAFSSRKSHLAQSPNCQQVNRKTLTLIEAERGQQKRTQEEEEWQK